MEEVAAQSAEVLQKPFSKASAQAMLKFLIATDYLFKTRRGRYAFAVPLLDQFILRQANLPPPYGAPTS